MKQPVRIARPPPGRRHHVWDPYEVFRILVRLYPARNADPSGPGRLDATTASPFLESIAEYPDYLQDACIIIAHAEGVEKAGELLDEAVRRYLRNGSR